MPDKGSITNSKIYLILFLISFAIVFCSSYNPINFRIMYVDSSVYITIAQGITRGQLPYRDFVDNKGPLTYLMSVPGLFIGGFTGVWLTELLIIFISAIFAFKTALFFGNQYEALFGTAFSFVALVAFFLVNAGTEEYSLPFLMISLYIFTKYFFSGKKDVAFYELIALGACFACAVLIRLNMFSLWAGFCIIIFFNLLIKRQLIFLGKYIVFFSLGIIIIFLPIYFYLKTNGIFDLFIEQVIFAGTARGFGGSNLKMLQKTFFIVLGRGNSALPLWLGIFFILKKYKQSDFTYYLGYTFSYFLMVLFLSFSEGGAHYNFVLIPFFPPALTYLTRIISSIFQDRKNKHVLVAFLFLCIFSESLIRYFYYLTNRLYDNSGNHLYNAGKIIDDNTKTDDKIISLGINGYIYPFTKRSSASKYFYQGSGISEIPGAREEFLFDILTAKPVIITTVTEGGRDEIIPDWHEPILELIKSDYHLLSDENGFIIFRRNYQ